MTELLDKLFSDTLWIYTALLGSIFGAAFVAYFKDTHVGIWSYGKFDQLLDYLVERWGWAWLKQPENAWRKKYPYVTKKIDELEDRIKKLEDGKRKKS
jgi:hypothetical protein